VIITGRSMVRIVPLVLAVVFLQVGFFSMVWLLGVSPWVLPSLVAIFGLLGGRMTGTVTGFAVGVLTDALVNAPLGASSLVLMAVGYACGSYRERGDLPSAPAAGLICGLATVTALILYGIALQVLGLGGTVSPAFLVELVIQGLYGFLLGLPLFVVTVRVLGPALVVGPSERRRRREHRILES
jgi:rod shape-determining protein MreD